MHEFRAKKAMSAAAAWSEREAALAICRLADADHAMKGGRRIDPELPSSEPSPTPSRPPARRSDRRISRSASRMSARTNRFTAGRRAALTFFGAPSSAAASAAAASP